MFTDTARCYYRGKPPSKSDRAAIFSTISAIVLKIPSTAIALPYLASKLQTLTNSFRPIFKDISPGESSTQALDDTFPKIICELIIGNR